MILHLVLPLLLMATPEGLSPPPPAPPTIVEMPPPPAPPPATVQLLSQRLQGALVNVVPIMKVIEIVEAEDPKWPIQDHPEALDDAHLACLRAHMDAPNMRKVVARRVEAYVRDNAPRLSHDLDLLEGDSGELLRRAIQAGVDSKQTGKDPDPADMVKGLRPDAALHMVALLNDPQERPLRELLGMSGTLNEGNAKAVGESMGRTYAVPMLFDAMASCAIPMSTFDHSK